MKWGEACGFGSSVGYNPQLDKPELRSGLEHALKDVQILLDSGIAISQTYLEDAADQDIFTASHGAGTSWSWTIIQDRLRKAERVQIPTTQVDSDEVLILDEIADKLSDALDNLEDVTKELGVPDRQRYLAQLEIGKLWDLETLTLMEVVRIKTNDMICDIASNRLRGLPKEDVEVIMDDIFMEDTASNSEVCIKTPDDSEDENFYDPVQEGMLIRDGSSNAQENHAYRYESLYVEPGTHGETIKRLSLDSFIKAIEERSEIFTGTAPSCRQRIRRVMSEIRSFDRVKEAGEPRWWNIVPLGNNLRYILATVEGPASSPYAGGIFHIAISFPDTYPCKPPKCRMLTRVYHPNISSTGEICLDILDRQWSPVLTLETLVISIGALLDLPGLEEPLVPEVAQTYKWTRNLYDRKAREFTEKYAQGVCPTAEKAQRFVDMCEDMNPVGK